MDDDTASGGLSRPRPRSSVDLRYRLRRRLGWRRAAALALLAAAAIAGSRAGTDPPSWSGPGAGGHGGRPTPITVDPEPGTARSEPEHRLGLADDERAVAIVRPLAPLPLVAGDVVELVAVRVDGAGLVGTERLAPGRVVVVDDRAITVAVAADRVEAVIEGQAIGSIELILTPR